MLPTRTLLSIVEFSEIGLTKVEEDMKDWRVDGLPLFFCAKADCVGGGGERISDTC
jgi:hypothetical protein